MISIFIDGKFIARDDVELVRIAQNFHRSRNHHLAQWINQAVPRSVLRYIYIDKNRNIFEKIFGFSSFVSWAVRGKCDNGVRSKSPWMKIDLNRRVDIRITNDAHQGSFESVSVGTKIAENFDEKHLESGATIMVDGRIVCQFSGNFVSGSYMFFFDRSECVHMIFRKLSTTDLIGDYKEFVINAREMRVLIRE